MPFHSDNGSAVVEKALVRRIAQQVLGTQRFPFKIKLSTFVELK